MEGAFLLCDLAIDVLDVLHDGVAIGLAGSHHRRLPLLRHTPLSLLRHTPLPLLLLLGAVERRFLMHLGDSFARVDLFLVIVVVHHVDLLQRLCLQLHAFPNILPSWSAALSAPTFLRGILRLRALHLRL